MKAHHDKSLEIKVYNSTAEVNDRRTEYLREKGLPVPHFFLMIIGQPKSGKTNLVRDLFLNKDQRKFYGIFDTLYIFSPSNDDFENTRLERHCHPLELEEIEKCYGELRNFKQEAPGTALINPYDIIAYNLFEESAAENEKRTPPKPLLNCFVFDDATEFVADNHEIFARMAQNRRHKHLSIILISHWYNRIPRRVRSIANYIIMFDPKNNNIEAEDLFKQRAPVRTFAEFIAILRFIFKKPHAFIYIDYANGKIYKNFDLITFSNHIELPSDAIQK